jgi:hypothetical protein
VRVTPRRRGVGVIPRSRVLVSWQGVVLDSRAPQWDLVAHWGQLTKRTSAYAKNRRPPTTAGCAPMQGHVIVVDGAAHAERRPPGPGELAHHLPFIYRLMRRRQGRNLRQAVRLEGGGRFSSLVSGVSLVANDYMKVRAHVCRLPRLGCHRLPRTMAPVATPTHTGQCVRAAGHVLSSIMFM